MQNVVPIEATLAERALAGRREHYAQEVRRLVDAAFAVTRRTGTLDPAVRDIVREAGLSNQAFYRHFPSRDALLLAVLADGRRQLVEYLAHRIATTDDPEEQLRRYVDGILAQARDRDAAAATRPFAGNTSRLAASFPEEVAASRAALLDILRPAIDALGGSEHDVEFVHDLAMARMHDALMQRRVPDAREVDALVHFCRGGIACRADAAEPRTAQRGSHSHGA
jgi:AcrR family transcriptional regulator